MPPRKILLIVPLAMLVVWLGSFCATTSAPPSIQAGEARTGEPTFAKEGVAFVEKHCVSCHGEKVKRSDLSLHGFRDEAAVLKDRKVWTNVLEVVRSGEMPPKKRPRPTAGEIDAFTVSVQRIFDHADKNAKPDPGRVTIRRLNRNEYNNTIRDLVGVDFQPADDFPSDDIGHGFDNIGDVLTLSPILLERYLAAAESIMQRAILTVLPKPSQRFVRSRYLEPATSKDFKWRPLAKQGSFHSLFRLDRDGEYRLRVRAYGESPDDEPVRIALSVDGKQIKTFDVKATKKTPSVYEVTTELKAGQRRGAVMLLNPAPMDAKPRTLQVEWMALVGPSDTRPTTQRALLASSGKTAKERTVEVLRRFATRAYRRPASEAEVARLVSLAEGAEKRGDSWEAAMQFGMQAVLISPKFLFRIELDDRSDSDKAHPLDEYQLASRLSYFLWSTMPDEELFRLAGKNQLSSNLAAQVARMLKDPKATALVDNFAMQWLQLRRLKMVSPDPMMFPSFNEELRSAMLKETELFFTEIIQKDRSILDLIDGDFTYLNEPLAAHYGITKTDGTRWAQRSRDPKAKRIWGRAFRRVELPEGDDRRGILSHASVLTVTSNPTRTSPVKRGRWMLEQILGTPPPPPPPDVPELVENDKAVLSGSLRQRMEQHRKNPSCANCHAKMDPMGFAFENYDAIGKFRTTDGTFPIDPSGTLPGGKTFKGPAELKAILKEKKELFARCLTEKMLIYALGRGLEHYDKRTVDGVVAAMAKNQYKFSTLTTEIVQSFPFRMRRGKDRSQ